MPIRVGFLTEGNDHHILRAYLAKLLDVHHDEIEPDFIDGTHGHEYVSRTIDSALRRFYHRCNGLVVVSMDNDGSEDLISTGDQQDPRRPRPWLHQQEKNHPGCRWCLIHDRIESTRPHLNWIPKKPSETWPIVIAVPVEMIEAWLLTTQAVLEPGSGSLHAERERRADFKMRFYGRPEATLKDVKSKAVPMIRHLELDHIKSICEHSLSFLDFADQIRHHSDEILTAPECW